MSQCSTCVSLTFLPTCTFYTVEKKNVCCNNSLYCCVHKARRNFIIKNWNVWNRAVYYVMVEVPFLLLVLLQINNREIMPWFVSSSTCL